MKRRNNGAAPTAKTPNKNPRISELTSVSHFDEDERLGGISGPKELFIDEHNRLYLRNERTLRSVTLTEAGEWYLRCERETKYSWRGGCSTLLELAVNQLAQNPKG
jgi:hypothetical protein